MAKIQLGTGSSSTSSHRITQSSQTLDRRYVGRPSNLIIDEAARAAAQDPEVISSTPSRLVNLRVHASDLQQFQQEEPRPSSVVPKVVELGSIDREMAVDPIGLTTEQIVPPEAPTYTDTVSTEVALIAPVPSEMISPDYSSNLPAVAAPVEIDTQSLAVDIAADYAAASFGASMSENGVTYSTGVGAVASADDSIDVIAQAASEAIAAIRTATDPTEVAEQVASLQDFAANIRATSGAPEMLELSDTIEKFVSVAMKSSKVQEEVEKRAAAKAAEAAKAAATIKVSTSKSTNSRAATKANARPSAKVTPKVSARPVATATHTAKVASKPRLAARRTSKVAPKLVADEDRALRKALNSVVAMEDEPTKAKKLPHRVSVRPKASRKRFALAFICATACVAAVVYFVGTSIPDISVKVAAMQTGIEAKYPSYIPRDFSLSDIDSENGKITLTFKGPDGASFILSEEKSSWDSTALLRNYVEPTWQSHYTTTHEQGITVYISGSSAAWVNGGVLYKINTPSSSSLTNKQLRNIVTSL